MKKSMLYAGLMTILSSPAFTGPQTLMQQGPTLASSSTNTLVPTETKTAPSPSPAAGTKPTVTTETNLNPPINCKYRIPATKNHIDQAVIVKWSEKAVEQSFNFDFNSFDKELAELKPCFTEQGWQGFNDALKKSGNIDAIKAQQLTVSAMVSGETKFTEIKDNQWKLIIPLQVVYQNEKQKLTQPLVVNLLVGRKVSGDLGIMQMIVTPQQTPAPKGK